MQLQPPKAGESIKRPWSSAAPLLIRTLSWITCRAREDRISRLLYDFLWSAFILVNEFILMISISKIFVFPYQTQAGKCVSLLYTSQFHSCSIFLNLISNLNLIVLAWNYKKNCRSVDNTPTFSAAAQRKERGGAAMECSSLNLT